MTCVRRETHNLLYRDCALTNGFKPLRLVLAVCLVPAALRINARSGGIPTAAALRAAARPASARGSIHGLVEAPLF